MTSATSATSVVAGRYASALFELVIGIKEWQSDALRKHLTDGRFARTHQANQKDVLRVHT